MYLIISENFCLVHMSRVLFLMEPNVDHVFSFHESYHSDFILSGTDFELFAYSIKLKCCSDVLWETCEKDLGVVLNSVPSGKAGVVFLKFLSRL